MSLVLFNLCYKVDIINLIKKEIALINDDRISEWWNQFRSLKYETAGQDGEEGFNELKINFLTCFFSLIDPRMTFREHIVDIV
jgi:hypothetical protein